MVMDLALVMAMVMALDMAMVVAMALDMDMVQFGQPAAVHEF
jgi:hypothetical protein